MTEFVPFNRPATTGREFAYIQEAIENGHLSGNGPFSRRCADWLEREKGVARALLTHSATGALEMAVILAGVEPGDEVIMPSFTFVSTANAVVLRGGVPVFVDVREDTLNIDESLVEDAITARTRALLPVHYAGVGAELDALCEIASRHGLVVIEDAAQALLATYRGRALGGIGDLGALSFHETKNVTCGEGGALLVRDPVLVERAEVLQEKGTDRSRFFRGQVDKYTWVDVGSSFLLGEMGAAFLWAQLEEARALTERRLAIWRRYHEGLEQLERDGALRRPVVPPHCEHNAHLYYILLEPGMPRAAFIARLEELGVNAVFHYVPLHSAPAGRRYARTAGELPQTEALSERLVRLPLWAALSDTQVDDVLEAVHVACGALAGTGRPS